GQPTSSRTPGCQRNVGSLVVRTVVPGSALPSSVTRMTATRPLLLLRVQTSASARPYQPQQSSHFQPSSQSKTVSQLSSPAHCWSVYLPPPRVVRSDAGADAARALARTNRSAAERRAMVDFRVTKTQTQND